MTKRVLMITYWYPPCTAWPSAAARVSGLAKYLPESGWEATVLAPALTEPLCDCRGCADRLGIRDEDEVTRVQVSPATNFTVWSRNRVLDRRAHPVRYLTTHVRAARRVLGAPDSDWLEQAEKRGRELLKSGAFGAVWTTSAPYEHTRLGAHLAAEFEIPHVADLRDPVSRLGDAGRVVAFVTHLRRRRFRPPLRSACAVTAVTPDLAQLDAVWLGRPVDTVLSGFDPDDFSSRDTDSGNDLFDVVYAGKVYRSYRRPEAFLRGWLKFVQSLDPDDRSRVRFIYYGRQGDAVRELVEEYGIMDTTEIAGFLEPSELRKRLTQSQVLLLLTNTTGHSGVPGGKFYEYLAARRPIFAVPADDEFVTGVLSRTGAGTAMTSPVEIKEQLSAFFSYWQQSGRVEYRGSEVTVRDFSIAHSAERLGSILDRCVRERDA